MKTHIVALVLVMSAAGVAGAGEAGSPSPVQLRIEAAQKVLQKQPNHYQAYNDLALALIRRVRETADTSYYQQARAAIENSLRIEPDNFEAGQAHVALLLAEHNYREALGEARALNHRMPDAVLVWGYRAEAEEALGDYDQAEKSAQWMMNLRPGNVPAYLCAAALREDWGDIDGALDFLSKALQQVPPLESEELAWIFTKMAQMEPLVGKPDAAEPLLQQALKTFPGYYLSLEELANVRLSQLRYPEAVELLEARNRSFPTAHSRCLEARSLELAGRKTEAEKAYAEFEHLARSQIEMPDNDNLELISYYADHAQRPSEALRIARLEIERRHEVRTLDAYAWALYVNGQLAEARSEMEKALSVGTRDAAIYYHAGAIKAASGEKAQAIHCFEQALDLAPTPEVAQAARSALTKAGYFTSVLNGQ